VLGAGRGLLQILAPSQSQLQPPNADRHRIFSVRWEKAVSVTGRRRLINPLADDARSASHLTGVALRTGGRRVWDCGESRGPPMRNELSTIPSSGQCDPTSPARPPRGADWLATCAPPHATSRGASRTASSHAGRRP
jgi:hypothetical protein